MLKNLPKGVKIILYSLAFFALFFVLLSVAVVFFKFPFSSNDVSNFLSQHNLIKTTDKSSNPEDSSFGGFFEKDSVAPTTSDVYSGLLEERVFIKSELKEYMALFVPAQIDEFLTYLLTENFFQENSVAYTYDPEVFLTSSAGGETPEPKFVTPETLTVYLTADLDSARIRSGSEIDMGLDYFAQDGNVAIYISVNPEDIKSNKELVEKTFSGLMYQGIYIATRTGGMSENTEDGTPDEYLLTPPEFYAALETPTPLVSISSRGLISLLLKFGILKEANAYCVGHCPEGGTVGGCSASHGGSAPCYYTCDCYDVCTACVWVNPPAPPPGVGCSNLTGSCNATTPCCDTGCLACVGGTCQSTCSLPPSSCGNCDGWTCGGYGGVGGASCGTGCTVICLPRADCQALGTQLCRCTPAGGCGGGSSCSYTQIPTCGTLKVIDADADENSAGLTCVSGGGLFDIWVHGVERGEGGAIVQVNNPDTGRTIEYSMRNQSPGRYRKENADLVADVGAGDIQLKFFVRNCFGWNNNCPWNSIMMAIKPDCPNAAYVSVTPMCGATKSRAYFEWWDWAYAFGAKVKPARWVLRVDHLSPLNPDGYQWTTINDFWKYVPSTTPIGIGTNGCGWHMWAGWLCSAVLDENSTCYNPLGGSCIGFKSGQYVGWSIQAVDACGDYGSQCSVTKGPFVCQNTAPTCGVINGPLQLFASRPGSFSSSVYDSIDPMTATWSAACSGTSGTGTFTPLSQTNIPGGSSQTISTNWASPPLASGVASGSCIITLRVSDTALQSTCSKTVTLVNPTVSGLLYMAETDSVCLLPIANRAPFNLRQYPSAAPYLKAGTSEKITIPSVISAPINSSGVFSTPFIPYGRSISSVYLSGTDLQNIPVDTNLRAVCVNSTFGSFSVDGSLGASASPSVTLTNNLAINTGYRLFSSLNGWFTVLGGSVYSGGGVEMAVSSASTPLVYRLPSKTYMTNDYAFSPADLNIAAGAESRIASSAGGYAEKIGEVDGDTLRLFKVQSPDSLNSITTEISNLVGFSNLSPSTIYRINVGLLNSVLADPAIRANYALRLSSNGVVVIYVTGSGTIQFNNNFISANVNRRILIVTQRPVQFSPLIGIQAPSGTGGDANVTVGIISSNDISFPSGITDPNNPNDKDSTMVFKGILNSEGTVDFSRDRKLDNKYPAEAIHFDPAYLYYLQRQLNSNSSFEKHFFSLVSISWEVLD